MTSGNRQDAMLDELPRGCSDPKDIFGEHGLLKQMLQGDAGGASGLRRVRPKGMVAAQLALYARGSSTREIQAKLEVGSERRGGEHRCPRPLRSVEWAYDRLETVNTSVVSYK